MKKVGQARLNHLEAETVPWAHSPTSTERQKLEILAFHVDVFPDESLRDELIGLVPYLGVSPDGPYVYEDSGVFGNIVAGDFYILSGESGHQHWCHRVHTHGLFDDCV